MKLEGLTVLITGGGSGIGLAFAKRFHALGHQVVICGRDSERLQSVAQDMNGLVTIACDISDADQRHMLCEKIKAEYPALNVLVNNAAIMNEFSFLHDQTDDKEIEAEVSINLTAPMQLIAQLMPILKAQPQAAIVNITSAIARVIHEPSPIYCASKAGLAMFTQTLRYQLRDSSVKVFEVSPPPVQTAMCQGATKMMTAEGLVDETLASLKRDRYNIWAGSTKLYYWLERFSPWVAKKVIGRV